MPCFLGIDTSNYTTSIALYDSSKNTVLQKKQLLPVKQGELGLRQSDAVFSHTKQLGKLLESLLKQPHAPLAGVGASIKPRDVEGSYMPCFLVGELVAKSVAYATQLPFTPLSHQAGHVAAALFSTGNLDWIDRDFIAFHFSGGTTDCLFVHPGKETPFKIELLAKSMDLKAGQVVDRVGGMLGLQFPAGKHLESLALTSTKQFHIKPTFHGMDCCLSGVENQCRKMLDQGECAEDVALFCISNIFAVTIQMIKNVKSTVGDYPIVFAGGVMSNSILQRKLAEFGAFAEPVFSTDNAAGVAILTSQFWRGKES